MEQAACSDGMMEQAAASSKCDVLPQLDARDRAQPQAGFCGAWTLSPYVLCSCGEGAPSGYGDRDFFRCSIPVVCVKVRIAVIAPRRGPAHSDGLVERGGGCESFRKISSRPSPSLVAVVSCAERGPSST